MSKPEWTPGPWLRGAVTVYALEHDGWRKGTETFRNRFCVSVQRTKNHDEDEANARLIQAAPDLYEALARMTLCFGHAYTCGIMQLGACNCGLDAAVAALAKARGEDTADGVSK